MNKIQIFPIKELMVAFSLSVMLLLSSIYIGSFILIENRYVTVTIDGSYIPAVMMSTN